MKAFMDKEFMLQNPTAQHLYHTYAEDMPICSLEYIREKSRKQLGRAQHQ